MPAMTFDTILNKAQDPTGCGVLVVRRDGKVLTGTRKENASRGQICGPGGHIEPGETPKEAAKREAMEEFGIICNQLVPLGTQSSKGGYGTSAVFLCTDYIGKPMTDEEEMTDAKWLTVDEIREQDLFPPFKNSLKLLPQKKVAKTLDEILKFNQNHSPVDGKFTSGSGGASGSGVSIPKGLSVSDSDRKMFSGKTWDEFQDGDDLNSYFSSKRSGEDHPLSKYHDDRGHLDPDRIEQAWYYTNLSESAKGAHKISVDEADRIVGDNIKDSHLEGWFRNADSGYKPHIEAATITKPEVRNAALNVAHENYNAYLESQGKGKIDFDTWLNTPITVYRGEHGQKHVKDDVFTAYSYDRKIAESFGSDVSEKQIRPIDTLGGYRLNAEYEIMVPSREFNIKGVKKGEAMENFNIFKMDDEKRLVFGWASVSIKLDGEALEDRQHDVIEPEDLEEAAYDYVLNFRDAGEEHLPGYRKKGKLVESCVLTKEKQRAMGIPEGSVPVAWWIGFKIEDDDAWERVKNGTYRMFSIEGKAEREPIEKTDRTARTLDEILKSGYKPKGDPMGRYETIIELEKQYDEIEEIQKFNQNHDALGRFSSGPGGGAGGRSYGSTGTGDALAEVRSGKTNSLAKHMDSNGNLTPEREQLHREIIDKLLEGKKPVNGQATMTMLGGGPASGKSSVMNPDTSNNPNAVTVDPDAIKKMLPGFNEMAKVDERAAAFYHEESSALAKRFSEVAYSENYDVIYDGTGDGSTKSVQKKIDAARAKGYRVEAKYVTIDTEEAVRRNRKRYEDAKARGETPRLPPEDMVRKTHAKCTDISVSMASQFDKIEIWDNNGAKGSQKKIAEGGKGKGLKVVPGQEQAFNKYLSKSGKGVDGFITLPNGQVVPVE